MRFLIISFLCLVMFASCALQTTKGLPASPYPVSAYRNTYFSDTAKDYIYKARINAYHNSFGGILIIKKTGDHNHRIAFTTDFGNTIFDFELSNHKFKTHFIIEQLNRKMIINTLRRDFETLTKEHNTIIKTFRNRKHNVYRAKLNKRYNHYIVNSGTLELHKIIHTTKTKEKTIITFNEVNSGIARHINIQHKSLPVTIDLLYLNNE